MYPQADLGTDERKVLEECCQWSMGFGESVFIILSRTISTDSFSLCVKDGPVLEG